MQLSKHSRKINFKKIVGQGMSEYLIIVGLIAVAGIAAMGFMGSAVRTQLSGMATELAGGNASTVIGDAQKSAQAASNSAASLKSLNTYGGQNELLK